MGLDVERTTLMGIRDNNHPMGLGVVEEPPIRLHIVLDHNKLTGGV
jgi:hypothetical protein